MTLSPRIAAIDAVRGMAVLGILAMNVVAFAMPWYAYVDPRFYGGAAGADLAAWAAAYVLFDGKMRALFTMLFGASLLIAADAAGEDAARRHYARIGWLLAFGMIHAFAFWYGDILVEYAVVGALVFAARAWRAGALLYAGVLLFGLDVVRQLIDWHDLAALRDLAATPGAPADAVRAWAGVIERTRFGPAALREIALYRGSFADAFAARLPVTLALQTQSLPRWLCGSCGIALIGMALHRFSFWRGDWPRVAYRGVMLAALPCLGGTALVARAIVAHRWDPAFLPLADAISQCLRLPIAVGYAALVIRLVADGRARRATEALGAAGRMAFSNYLATTLVMTTIFYGYGLGLFGQVGRAALCGPVAAMWAAMLLWSRAWLARYRMGPLEWLWRSLARWKAQPLRRTAIATD